MIRVQIQTCNQNIWNKEYNKALSIENPCGATEKDGNKQIPNNTNAKRPRQYNISNQQTKSKPYSESITNNPNKKNMMN